MISGTTIFILGFFLGLFVGAYLIMMIYNRNSDKLDSLCNLVGLK